MASDDDSARVKPGQKEKSLPRRRLLTLAGMSLTAGIAGCGGDGDDTDTPTDTAAETDTATETVVPTDTAATTPTDNETQTTTPGEDTPEQPLPPDPPSLVSLDGASTSQGGTTTLTGSLVNPYVHPVGNVSVELQAPGGGWTLTATEQTEFDSVETQGSRDLAWELTAPEDASGQYTVEGTVHFETTTDAADVAFSATVSVFTGDVSAGLSAHWSFDSGTVSDDTVADQSPNGNDGTFVGDPSVDAGVIADGLALSGDDWVQVNHSDSLQVQTGDFTLAAWVNPQSSMNQMGVISKKTDDGVDDSNLAYQIILGGYQDAGGLTTARAPTFVYNDGSTLRVSAVDQSLSTGTWYHLAASYDYDNSTVEWFVDGSSVKSEQLTGTPITNEQELFLGVHFDIDGVPSNALNGTLDDIRVYDEAKDGSFIGELYARGTPSG